jgi:hypothetical protein
MISIALAPARGSFGKVATDALAIGHGVVVDSQERAVLFTPGLATGLVVA